MDYWVTIGTAILGGGLALAGVFISNRNNRILLDQQIQQTSSAEKKSRQREAGEELFERFSKWSTFVTSSQFTLYPVMKGSVSYNDHLDSVIDSANEKDLNHHRIEFLVRTYFPNLQESYGEVQSAITSLNKVVAEHKRSYNSGEEGLRFVEPFSQAIILVGQKSDTLKDAIVVETRKYL